MCRCNAGSYGGLVFTGAGRLSAGERASVPGAAVSVEEIGVDGIGSAEHAAMKTAAQIPKPTICRHRNSNRLMKANLTCFLRFLIGSLEPRSPSTQHVAPKQKSPSTFSPKGL